MKKGNAQIRVSPGYEADWQHVLVLLYRPLLKQDGFLLYHIFHALDGLEIEIEQLCRMSGMSVKRFEKAHETLEEFRLLKTYVKPGGKEYLFDLYPPMSAYEFLKDNTFGRLVVAGLGSKYYDTLKMHFLKKPEQPKGWIEMTKPFDSSRLNGWNDEQEAQMAYLRPNAPSNQFVQQFDFDTFFTGMERIFMPRYRTRSNLDLIASLAQTYGIAPEDMRKYVNRACNPHTHEFNANTLEKVVHSSLKKPAAATKDPYQMPPMQFFQMKQSAPVAGADEKLIKDLSMNYGFSTEVVNILIEYVLEATGQSFQRSYVEKIASSWNRLKIRTREQALARIQQESRPAYNTGVNTGLPEWYANTETTPVNSDVLARALEAQRKASENK
nr:DnaD domain protein [uncultured Dubosiella sp.]